MEEFLLDMMNQGFIIYIEDNKFVLKKIDTPASPKMSLFDLRYHAEDDGKSYCQFDSMDEALEKAKDIMGWKSNLELQAEVKKTHASLWELELTYKHRGFPKPRFVSLGQVANVDHAEAVLVAMKSAEIYIAGFPESDVEDWEIRARPAK